MVKWIRTQMTSSIPTYTIKAQKIQPIAMVHIGSTVALQNTSYNTLLNISTYSTKDLETLTAIRKKLYSLHEKVVDEYKINYLEECKSSVFLLKEKEVAALEEKLLSLSFVKRLVDRAVGEVSIYVRNGVQIISLENFGAPYFLGDKVSFEELFILYVIAKKVRDAFPEVPMGIHVLSSDELESLPIAIASQACFIRSEATIFSGFRPEGRTENKGTLAKLFYLRNFFHAVRGVEDPEQRLFPKVWSDLQKKHTVFEEELRDLSLWLNNLLFMKLEGVILTGLETGKDVTEKDLKLGREALEKLQEQTQKYFGQSIQIPLITGSGLDIELYKKYADFVITGTQLKKNKYWENEVSEENVKSLVQKFR